MDDLAPPVPTHQGWLLFCPIYLAGLESEAPIVWERLILLAPVFKLAVWLQQSAITALSMLDPDYEPQWMFWRVRRIDANA